MGLGWDPGWEQGALPTGLAPPLLTVEATWRDMAWGGALGHLTEGGEAELDAPFSPPFSRLLPTSHRQPQNEKWDRRR